MQPTGIHSLIVGFLSKQGFHLKDGMGIALFIFVVFFMVSCQDSRTARQIPVEDFFRKPEKSHFLISPDGNYISFLQEYGGKKNIFINHLQDHKTTRITSETDEDIVNYFWANDKELIFQKNRAPDEPLSIYAVNRDLYAVRNLITPQKMRLRWLGDHQRADNDELLVALNKRDSSVFDVYRLHINDCSLNMVAKNPGNITKWYTDLDGKIRLAISSDGVNETILYRQKEEAPFVPVMTNNFMSRVKPLRFIQGKPDHIYALSNLGRDKLAFVEIDLKKAEEVRTIYHHPDVDLNDIRFSESQQELLYAQFDTSLPEKHFFNDAVDSIHQFLKERLENREFDVLDANDEKLKYIIRSYSDTDPGAIYFFSYLDSELIKLADVNSTLNGTILSEMKPIAFQASDGKTLNGYLTLPIGTKGKNLPLIVMPHNGPSWRNVWGYNNEVQFLANRGYAVLQVNYRGSTGYGKEFWISGFRQWGGKIQEDIADGVRYLIKNGVVNPEKIGVYGFSFGGFSALYGACFYDDLYTCAVSYSGITNLFTYLKEIPPYYKQSLEMFYEQVGNPNENPDYFKEVSPIFHTDKIEMPVFIAQGGKDDRGNVNETNQIVRELKARNVQVQYLMFEKEGHYFTDEENRFTFYHELDRFLAKHLK